MRPEIIHEQIVSVVDEEVQRVQHLLVVAHERHFQILINDLFELGLSLVFFVDQLNLPLLLRLFQEEIGIPYNLIRLLHNFFNVLSFAQEFGVVLLVVFVSLFGKELLTHISPLIQLFSSELNIDKVGLLQNLIHFIHLFALEFVQVMSHIVKEIINCVSDRVPQIKLLTVCNHHTILHHLIQLFVDVLDKVLRCSFQEKNLVVVVAMVRQITTFFAHQFVVDDAECYIGLKMIRTRLHSFAGL